MNNKKEMMSTTVLNEVYVVVADPEVVQDMFIKENKYLDKHRLVRDTFAPMFDTVWPTMATTETWKTQRKATSHMFYKNKL